MPPPLAYPAALVLDGWRAPALALSEAGVTLSTDTPLVRLLASHPRGATHAVELEWQQGGQLHRHPVRVRLAQGGGEVVEVAFTALPGEVRARLRAAAPPSAPAVPAPALDEGRAVRLARGEASTCRLPTQLPGGRRLVLSGSADLWRQTRRRREALSAPAPAPPPPALPPPPSLGSAPPPDRRVDAAYFVAGLVLLAVVALLALLLLA